MFCTSGGNSNICKYTLFASAFEMDATASPGTESRRSPLISPNPLAKIPIPFDVIPQVVIERVSNLLFCFSEDVSSSISSSTIMNCSRTSSVRGHCGDPSEAMNSAKPDILSSLRISWVRRSVEILLVCELLVNSSANACTVWVPHELFCRLRFLNEGWFAIPRTIVATWSSSRLHRRRASL